MPTYLLKDQERTTIARRRVQVSVTVDRSACPIVLEATCGGGPDGSAIVPRPGFMILPRVADRTVIRVVPGNGAIFPAGTRVGLMLRTEPDRGDPEPDEVIVRTVDVSGLGSRDLAAVDVDGPRLGVSALAAVVAAPVGRLQAMARAAAVTAVLGVDRLTGGLVEASVVAIDMSVSMAPAVAEGSVEAVVDVVAGISLVVGHGRPLRVCLLGKQPVWLPETPIHELAVSTARQVNDFGFEYGFRSWPAALRDIASEARTVVYVVTDGIPADGPDSHAPDAARHLVTIGPAGGPVPTAVPYTAFPSPPPGRRAADHLLGSPPRLAELVSSLLADRFAPGIDPKRGQHR